MPSVPIVMPSVIEMVLTSMGVPPAARIALHHLFRELPVIPVARHGADPAVGHADLRRARSSSVKPTAFIIARGGRRGRCLREGSGSCGGVGSHRVTPLS
jgi:hypothetical protein